MSISREVLAKYIKPGCTFVECGSRWGDSLIRAIECGASKAWGCEADGLYADFANRHVQEACPKGNAVVYHMDSVRFLIGAVSDGVVFLDAHTETFSPVLMELSEISKWPTKPYAILIDDMRCMESWRIEKGALYSELSAMGYTLSREDGIIPGDILVGQQ